MNCCDEYCANHGCNQGRDCPARVAKYRPIMRAADPLPPSAWRRQLKALAKWFLMSIIAWMIWIPLFYLVLRE